MNVMRFLIRASRGIVILSAGAGAAGGVAGIALIALIQEELTRERSSSSVMAWAFGALCIIAAAARVIGQVGMVKMGQRAVSELSMHMVRCTLGLSLREFKRIDSSALLTALTEDIVLIANAMVGVPQLCINIPLVIACVIYIGWLSPVIFVWGVVFATLAIGAYLGLSTRAINDLRQARIIQNGVVEHYRALIDGFRELKLHRGRRAAYLAESLEPSIVSACGQTVRGLSTFAFAEGFSQLAFFGFIGIVLFVISSFEPISHATLVAVVLVVLYLMGPLDAIVTWIPILGRARASLTKVQSLIPTLERRNEDASDQQFPASRLAFDDCVSLEGASFTYHDEHDHSGFTLGPVDLTLRVGELVILAGGNGSGKTTLVELISGLYKPDSGLVRLDGRLLEDQDREAYRQLFSVVFADGHLFPNLLGLHGGEIELKACNGLERLGLADRVSVLGGRFSTIDLSQGQRRRLALLGALLEDRPIFIFDEWAANQDPTFKHMFYDTFLRELRAAGKTLLVISHDENHFGIADRVIRLQDGRLHRRIGLGDLRGRATWRDRRMKKLLVFLGLIWGGGAFGMWFWTDHGTHRVSYRTVVIRRGDLSSTINATGTIEPEEVIDVGAQVAGLIQSFGVDPREPSKPISYGSQVEQGTVLAQLDKALFQARVNQARGQVAKAEADIEQARAKLRQAERELERTKKLRSRPTAFVAEQEYDAILATHEAAAATLALGQSSLLVAQADLEEATANLGYTTIRSPVKGIILDRRINIGQTVVANLNAPSLFLIAKDLSRLEIWSSVNETDIGSIHEGQVVRFTVSASPKESFEGKVTKIRLNASMLQNVVTYTVVIAVDNASGRLMPYLTARLQFEVTARKGVLLVPNAALRWRPRSQDVVPAVEEIQGLAPSDRSSESGAPSQPEPAAKDGPQGVLWIRAGRSPEPHEGPRRPFRWSMTEVSGSGLIEGTEIVIGAIRIDSEPDALSILPHTWSEPQKK